LVVVSTEDLSAAGLKAYPNPAANTLMIESETDEISAAYIYNTTGQLVKSVRDINSNTVNIDVSDLSSGFYMLKIMRGDADAANISIIKR
jgi:hypothetical protein